MAIPYDVAEKGRGSNGLAGDKACQESYTSIDHVLEKKLVRKLDIHIVPVVMLLYLLSFLDRSVASMEIERTTKD